MQTLLTAAQMRMADAFTIANQPISSLDLMEKAAEAFVSAFLREEMGPEKAIAIFCGKGNNGGDGLAIARLLLNGGYTNLKVVVASFMEKQSNDFTANLQRLQERGGEVMLLEEPDELKNLQATWIIDALIGSGLNKPINGKMEQLVSGINQLCKKVYAVDVPTGFFTEGALPKEYNGIKAYKTICFQRPKINFFFPESVQATEHFEVVDIGLVENFIQSQSSGFYLTEAADIRRVLKPRQIFSHKGTYGHALLIAGNTHTMGAALLASKACLFAGAGLTTACIPLSGLVALNAALPEVMALPASEYPALQNPEKYQSIAIGPGWGISAENEKLLESLMSENKALILDADALNILAYRRDLLDKLPKGSILTPHVKEFDRLFGEHVSWWDRVCTAQKQAVKYQCVVVLKNQYTFIVDEKGKVFINPTGNPGMAQGGMGDVLTGIIAAYVAQGISVAEAAMTACYFHGKSGDDLAADRFNVTASQVAENLPNVVQRLINH